MDSHHGPFVALGVAADIQGSRMSVRCARAPHSSAIPVAVRATQRYPCRTRRPAVRAAPESRASAERRRRQGHHYRLRRACSAAGGHVTRCALEARQNERSRPHAPRATTDPCNQERSVLRGQPLSPPPPPIRHHRVPRLCNARHANHWPRHPRPCIDTSAESRCDCVK